MLHVSEAQRQVGQGVRNQDIVSANDCDNDAFDSQLASKLTFKTRLQHQVGRSAHTQQPVMRSLAPVFNLHQRGQLLCRVRVPEVDPPAGAAEGRGGEQRPVRREVAGRQEVQSLACSSRQVSDEGVRAQTPQTHHLNKHSAVTETQEASDATCV